LGEIKMIETIKKPWGEERILFDGTWRTKVIKVNKDHQTSLQYHKEKDEYWFYLWGDGKMYSAPFYKSQGVVHVPPGTKHRLIGAIAVVEVAKGSDSDIVRIEDDYDREGTTER
jgi:mannose-6-phosphate isomerase-like protein (cupin superfamily)